VRQYRAWYQKTLTQMLVATNHVLVDLVINSRSATELRVNFEKLLK